MFRAVLFTALCAAPLVISSTAGAQSLTVTGEADVIAPASSAPVSIMQRYVPRADASSRELGLLIDEGQQVAQTAPVAGVSLTSGAVPTRVAVNDLAAGRSIITVSNVRGVRE